MDLSNILRPVFAIAFIGIIYIIIIIALRIMYSDVKNGNKKAAVKKAWGLEVISSGENANLKVGGVIPIRREINIGRKEDNDLILKDPYVSGHHVKIFLKNTDYYIEDLGSTNGTELNDEKIHTLTSLELGDEIKLGNILFKVIG